MGHPFGDLLTQYRARKHGLTQARLAALAGYHPPVITRMAQGGKDLTGPSGRERVVRLIEVLRCEGALTTLDEANALLKAARMPPLFAGQPEEAALLRALREAVATSDTTAGPAREPHATNLPAQLTPFIGREREVADVRRLLASHRLVTLTGAGGVGKTRLALEVGASLVEAQHRLQSPDAPQPRGGASPLPSQPAFPDGVWRAELAPVSEAELLPNVLVRLFGLAAGTRTAHEVLIDHLRGRILLLILDNCEHLIQACAELTESLLRACPSLRVLATSREGLSVSGEVAWRVPSLTAEEAVRLFEDRARAARQDFRLTEQNEASVARVCVRLGGIPLAIEMAAARIRTFTVEQVEARLDDVFRLLTSGSRSALPRHRTLRAMIDWSYDLLPEAERTVLRRLSVFAGGWTVEAAEAVAAAAGTGLAGPGAADVPALLDQLVGKSMVQADQAGGEPRYRMLEVMRQYAHAKLVQAGEHEQAHGRHLAYFCDLTDHLNVAHASPHDLPWVDRVQEEMDNVRAALEWVVRSGDALTGERMVGNLTRFWGVRDVQEGLRWARAILPDPRTAATPGSAAHVHYIFAWLNMGQGAFRQAYEHFSAALPLAHRAGDYALITRTLSYLIEVSPDVAQVRAAADELLHIAREGDRASAVAETDYALGRRARLAGDFTEAARRLRASAEAYRALGYPSMVGQALGECGFLAADQGDLPGARALWEQALAIYRQAHNPAMSALALVELAPVVVRLGDAAAALPMVQECIGTFYKLGNLERVGESATVAAWVAHRRGDMPPAARLLGAAEGLWQRSGQDILFRTDERAEYERLLPQVRAELPPDEFEAAWAEGQHMTLDQVIADVMAM
jgi:non-specific serine/threonine protein kinase